MVSQPTRKGAFEIRTVNIKLELKRAAERAEKGAK